MRELRAFDFNARDPRATDEPVSISVADVRQEWALLSKQLIAARLSIDGMSPLRLARKLKVSESSVYSMESGLDSLTVHQLIAWARAVKLRPVIVDASGIQVRGEISRERGETLEHHEYRQLIAALRSYRDVYLWLGKTEVARRAGLHRDSIGRWEAMSAPPEIFCLVSWVMGLGCRLRLIPLRARRAPADP